MKMRYQTLLFLIPCANFRSSCCIALFMTVNFHPPLSFRVFIINFRERESFFFYSLCSPQLWRIELFCLRSKTHKKIYAEWGKVFESCRLIIRSLLLLLMNRVIFKVLRKLSESPEGSEWRKKIKKTTTRTSSSKIT